MSSANAAAYQAGAASAAPGSPLDMLFQQFGQLEAQTLLQEFLSALSAGVNPRQIAKELSDTIDQLSYGRAETIMRTESLGAWNDAALDNYRANSDIIGSWMWVCMPGAGTCVSCLEEDGSIYSLDEELDDHPNGRCCKGPVTNDYGDILSQYGIDASGMDFGPGPWDDRQTGEEWLLAQDAATQRAAFGSNAAFNAWKVGDAKLADFVAVRHDAVWGDSIYQQSLKGMGLDARDYAAGKVAYAAEMPEVPGIGGAEPGALDMTANPEVKFIAKDDIAAWAASNAADVPASGWHYGTEDHIDRLMQNGVNVARNKIGVYGRGFYVWNGELSEAALEGDKGAEIAVHMENPYRVQWDDYSLMERIAAEHPDWATTPEWEDLGGGVTAPKYERLFAEQIQRQGYDGVLVFRDGKVQEEVAIKAGTVRVVSDERAAAEAAAREATTAALTQEDALAAIKAEEQRYKDLFMGTGAIAQNEAAAAIAARLPADFDYASMREAMKITPQQISLLEKARILAPGEANLDNYTIFQFLQEYHTFAGGTSTGTPFQIMLQEAAEREFGLTNVQKYWTADKLAAGLEQYGEVLPEFQQVMRSMYDSTQAWFQERGITEVTLYRGESWTAALRPKDLPYDATIHTQEIPLKPLSSWSTSLKVGSEYAQGEGDVALKAYGAIERIQMPVDRILSVPGTGFGANFLQEMLVLGDKTDADMLALKTELGSLISHEKVYDAFAEAAAKAEATTAAREVESPAIQQMRSDRAALQAQKDAIQAKQDVLSEKWAKIVRETDFTEEDEAAAAEKKLAAIEKQQGTQITKMEKLDAKMAKLDAKLPEVPRVEPLAREATSVTEEATGKIGNEVISEEFAKVNAGSFSDNFTRVSQDLTNRMGDNKDFAAWASERGQTPDEFSGDLLRAWNSGQDNELEIAEQLAVRDEFNLEDASLHVPKAPYEGYDPRGLYAEHGDALRGFVRANYDATQQMLKDEGITSMRVYRGAGWADGDKLMPKGVHWGEDGTATLPFRPISSFSADESFAEGYGIGISATPEMGGTATHWMQMYEDVPAKDILSTGLTGMGMTPNSEVLVLGGKRTVEYASDTVDTFAEKATLREGVTAAEATDVAQAAELTPEAAAATQSIIHGAPMTYTLPEIDQKAEAALIQQIQDAIPDAGVASHTDAIDIGATVDRYVQERIGPLQDYVDELNAIRTTKAADLTGDQIAWIAGDTSQHGGLTTGEVMQQYQAARQQETVRLLSQVRDVGGTDLELAGGAPAALEDAIRQAQDVFPTQWLDASNNNGAIKLVQEQTRLGYYRASDNTLAIRVNDTTTPDQIYTTAMHEMGHNMEASVDGVWQMERDFYDARTAGERFRALDPSLRVLGRTKVDQWANEYLGIAPIPIARPGGLPPIEHYELLSNGLQWLLGADPNGAYWLSLDPEYRQFIYGILFGTRS